MRATITMQYQPNEFALFHNKAVEITARHENDTLFSGHYVTIDKATGKIVAGTKIEMQPVAQLEPIRNATSLLKLRTEASLRFEKGLGPGIPEWVQHRALHLMEQLTGGRVASGLVDVYPGQEPRRTIILLVMQTLDNSISLRAKKRWFGRGWRLSTEQNREQPNPTFIEAGNLGGTGRTTNYTEAGVMWQTIIHIVFILSAVGIAYVDKLSNGIPALTHGKPHKGGGRDEAAH
mgnify:CR=1 FL=1